MKTEKQTEPATRPWWLRLIIGRNALVTVMRAALWVALAVFIFKVVLVPVRIQGVSMRPTYENGGINFINRWSYLRHPPQRGDVVGIQYPGLRAMLLKRIVALPGERIGIRQGVVRIDGEPLEEPYLKLRNEEWERAEEQLGPNHYFVIGDNRGMAISEHKFGRVEAGLIIGKVLY